MSGKRVLWLVGTECAPEREQEFNEWYGRVHLPMLLKVPGVVAAARYEAVNPAPGQPKYLAVYEVEDEEALEAIPQTPEMLAARAERLESWGEAGFSVMRREYYRAIG